MEHSATHASPIVTHCYSPASYGDAVKRSHSILRHTFPRVNHSLLVWRSHTHLMDPGINLNTDNAMKPRPHTTNELQQLSIKPVSEPC